MRSLLFMPQPLKLGIIGFDTSHVPAFTQLLNDSSDPHHIGGAQVVAGVPTFSADLASSASRVEGYSREMREKHGVAILDSIEELLDQVDAILLESVDGRRHLQEATPVIKARKPLFIDKPLAASYNDARQIAHLAKQHDCPIFSASSLRFDANLWALKNDASVGEILTCDAFSPALLDSSNPGFFWYGIHGVEILYSVMGTGCEKVFCHQSESHDVAVGTWLDGRIATMRGTRRGAHDYGVTAFGTEKVVHAAYSRTVPLYAQLLRKVIPFLAGGAPPVAMDETLEIMAFMQAALLSTQEKREVELDEIVNALSPKATANRRTNG